MVKKIAAVVVVLIVALLAYAATRPDSFRLERTTTIKAPPEKVFALINDFHQWGSWSPWDKIDADLKRTYSGQVAGFGAVYAWDGSKAGVGRMEIVESLPASLIKIKLDFLKPFEAHNTAEFSLHAQGDVTNVTWAMYGPSSYVSKVMGIFFNMDEMIGRDFESGLEKMRSAAEK
jgi:uncharacterized protein YndB with AHSA1/START domain